MNTMHSCLVFSAVLALGWTNPATAKPIRLQNRTLDPDAPVAQQSSTSGAGANLAGLQNVNTTARDGRAPFWIQFSEPISDETRARLSAIGAVAVGYVPEDALLVLVDPDQLAGLSQWAGVRWVGAVQAGDKLSAALAQPSAAKKASAELTVVISVLRPDYVPAVADAVAQAGGTVESQGAGKRWGTVRARVPSSALSGLAALAEVEWIEPYVQPELNNNVAVNDEFMNVRSVWTNRNLRGEGQIIAVGDSGLDTGDADTIHPDFSNRIHAAFGLVSDVDWSDHSGHGTHVAGSVLGSGAAYSNGLFSGVAPEARLVFQAIGGLTAGSSYVYPPEPLNVLFEQARTNGARIHTDSWGSSVDGEYTSNSRDLDEFMWDYDDMLVLFSAGNSGRDLDPTNGVIDAGSMGAPGTAKNCLTVGAAESSRPIGSGGYSSTPWGTGSWLARYPTNPIRDDLISTPADGIHQGMAAFSSRGPCTDGRIKPDIVAPGTDIVSCRSRVPDASTLWGTGTGVLGNSASNLYTFSGGTSMSTPLTAGAAGLARQYFTDVRGMTNPSAAMLKAVLVNGARTLAPGQYGVGDYREIPDAPRPNNVEGWGHVNLDNSLFPASGRTNLFWDRQSLTTGRTNRYPVVVTGTQPLNITLAWSDYPATLSAAQQLVNDLDLRLVAPSGAILYPYGASGPDRTNNLLGIDVATPETGTNWIEVVGHNVPMGPQKFALMAQGEGHADPVVQVYGAWHEPAAPLNAQTVTVYTTVSTGPGEPVAVVAAYRVNSNAWNYVTLSFDLLNGETKTYRGELPPFQSRDHVEYYVYAMDPDLGAISSGIQTFSVGSDTLYVSRFGSSTWPYDSWDRAFTNLAQAVGYARNGFTILVTNGTYRGATLEVNRSLVLTSMNGPAVTFVDGQNTRLCASITANAQISGFTFQSGYNAENGGAVTMTSGTLSNCVIRNSESGNYGGGLHLENGTVTCCRIESNFARYFGGGVFQSGGVLSHSVVFNNLSRSDGGGIEFWGGEAVNCTFANNHAGGSGGGFDVGDSGLVLNNIIYSNTAQGDGANWYKWVDEGIFYSCTSPNPGDEGCFDADPLFANASTRDYHLKSAAGRFVAANSWTHDSTSSPCIDRGFPGSDYSAEPAPNGQRINVGAYGGTEQASMTPWLTLDPTVTNLPAASSSNLLLSVSANVAFWTATASNAAWIQISGGTGSSNGTVTFAVAENIASVARTGTIQVSGGGLTATCTVVQAGFPVLSVAPTNQSVGSTTGSTSFAISNEGDGTMPFTASESEPWLSLSSGTSGTNAGTLTVDYEANPGTAARTGTVTVTAAGASNSPVSVTIVQAGRDAWDAGYQDLGGGWRRLAWFGDYIPMGNEGWIWHNKHGFFYIPADATAESLWLYATDMQWLWTSSSTYPFLYRASDLVWLWYNGQTNPRWFMNLSTHQWEQWP